MASEYSVNIKLNTKQVKADLQTIGKEIGNLGRNQSKGSKKALSDAEAAIKIKNTQLALENKILRIQNSLGPLSAKNIHQNKVMAALGNAQLKTDTKQFDLAKQSILLAEKEIQANKRILTSNKAIEESLKKQNLLRGKSTGFTAGQYGPQLPGITQSAQGDFSRLSDGQSRNAQGGRTFMNNPFARMGVPMPTQGFDAQSALISGGFPLLFGQGPVTAAAGAVGGGVGGMFGQMGGFAGGIAATAAVQAIQNTMDSVSKLGQAFNTLTPDVESLTAALGANGTERERQIQLIKKTQGEQAALAAVTEQMNQQIGEKGVKNLKEFGETSRLIGNSFQILGTKMLAALAPILNFLAQPLAIGARKAETSRLANVGGAANDPEVQALEAKLGNVGRGRSANKQREKIQEQIDARKEELALLGKTIERRTTVDMVEDSVLKKGRQQNELLQAKLDGNYEEVLLAQQVEEKVREMLDNKIQEGEIDRKSIEDQIKKNQLLEKQIESAEKLKDKMTAVGEEIESSIKNNLRDAITGAQSFGEAMSNVLNKIRDKLLDKALDNIFGGFGENFGKSATGGKGKGIGGFIGGLFGFADGGKPPVGRPSIVGERGPELFVPRSAGTVVPNEKIGGTNITNNISISVDATDSNVQSDEDGQQFGEAIANAIQAEIVKQQRSGGLLR